MDVIMALIKTPRDQNMSKEEFISRRSLELDDSKIRTAASRVFDQDVKSRSVYITVEGYDTSLPEVDLRLGLSKSFSPCGQVRQVEITKDPVTNLLNRCARVTLVGKGAEERALALDGSDFGGWNAVIRSLPNDVSKPDPSIVASLRAAYARKSSNFGIFVEGYDTSLPLDVVKDAVIRHFCTCGEMTQLGLSKDDRTNALHSSVLVKFARQDAVEKALALNGSDAGGWKVAVRSFPEPIRFIPDSALTNCSFD